MNISEKKLLGRLVELPIEAGSWLAWYHLSQEFGGGLVIHTIIENDMFTDYAKKFVIPMIPGAKESCLLQLKKFIINNPSTNYFCLFSFSEHKIKATCYYFIEFFIGILKEIQAGQEQYRKFIQGFSLSLNTITKPICLPTIEPTLYENMLELNNHLKYIKSLLKDTYDERDRMYAKSTLSSQQTLPNDITLFMPIIHMNEKNNEQLVFAFPNLQLLQKYMDLYLDNDAMILQCVVGGLNKKNIAEYSIKNIRPIELEFPGIQTGTEVHGCKVKAGQRIIHDIGHWYRQSMIPSSIRKKALQMADFFTKEGKKSIAWELQDLDYPQCLIDRFKNQMKTDEQYILDILNFAEENFNFQYI